MSSRLYLFVIYSIGFLDHMGLGLAIPIFTLLFFDPEMTILPFETSTEIRGFWLGFLLALTPLTQFFCAPILGSLSDRKGRKVVLQIGMAIAFLGYAVNVLGIIFSNLPLLIISRILIGASDGTVPVAQAAIADISTEDNKARRFSLFNMCLGTGFAVGPFIGGFMADSANGSWCGYASPFMLAGLISFCNLLLVSMQFPAMPASATKEQKPYKIFDGLLNLKRAFYWLEFRHIFAASFTFGFGWSFFAEFMSVYLKEVLNFNIGELGYSYAYNSIWYALCTGLLTLPILKRYRPEKIVSSALLFGGLFFPFFLFVKTGWDFALFNPILMYALALIFPTMGAMVSNMAGNDRQGEVLGVYHSVFAMAFGLSPLIGGIIVGMYPASTAIVASASFLISGSLLVWRTYSALSPKLEENTT